MYLWQILVILGYNNERMSYIYDFSPEKNHRLTEERNLSFEEIIYEIEEGNLLDVLEHPNKSKYPNQKIYVMKINNYIYLVPVIIDQKKIFLKTIVPSRKATRDYLKGDNDELR